MRRGVVEKDDLDLVFGRFERLEGGLMGFSDFGRLVADLKLGLREGEKYFLGMYQLDRVRPRSVSINLLFV